MRGKDNPFIISGEGKIIAVAGNKLIAAERLEKEAKTETEKLGASVENALRRLREMEKR